MTAFISRILLFVAKRETPAIEPRRSDRSDAGADIDRFTALPDNERRLILSKLPARGQIQMGAVNKAWWAIAREPEGWLARHARLDSNLVTVIKPKSAHYQQDYLGVPALLGLVGGGLTALGGAMFALNGDVSWQVPVTGVGIFVGSFVLLFAIEPIENAFEARHKANYLRYRTNIAQIGAAKDAVKTLSTTQLNPTEKNELTKIVQKGVVTLEDHGQAAQWEKAATTGNTKALERLLDRNDDFRVNLRELSSPAFIASLMNQAIRENRLNRATALRKNDRNFKDVDGKRDKVEGILDIVDRAGMTPRAVAHATLLQWAAQGKLDDVAPLARWLDALPAELYAHLIIAAIQKRRLDRAQELLNIAAADQQRALLQTTTRNQGTPRQAAHTFILERASAGDIEAGLACLRVIGSITPEVHAELLAASLRENQMTKAGEILALAVNPISLVNTSREGRLTPTEQANQSAQALADRGSWDTVDELLAMFPNALPPASRCSTIKGIASTHRRVLKALNDQLTAAIHQQDTAQIDALRPRLLLLGAPALEELRNGLAAAIVAGDIGFAQILWFCKARLNASEECSAAKAKLNELITEAEAQGDANLLFTLTQLSKTS